MSTAKRIGMPRYLRKPVIARTPTVRLAVRPAPVLIRTVAFVPAYLRKRAH
ncbi:MAG TPA: hypothetical protein VLV56_05220 [Burkholderiales bacterium]|jgi:hypothetical protein|nr:hypothetical protein [Burkholderiales bacterium]